ncbi:MAG: aldo/keto reductase [Thermacetogeniaceae bacterium]
MRYRTLGKAELQVSEIGFGGIPIQHVAQDDVDGIVARALDLGINFFDTARGYTDSEQKLGTAFKGKRDRVLIATKSLARTRAGIW